MSGICGVWELGGAPADAGALDAMLGALQQRGPHAAGRHVEGALALGHAALHTTPEDHSEAQPLAHRESGCIITADARLDYRADLIARLGLSARETGLSDAALIMRAYLKWGTQCLDHLEGDFAFALYDPREHHLLCARDRTGMRQLMVHHQPGELFACATDERALLRHPKIPQAINEGRIADYLEDLEAIDLEQTFYQGIHRLPPAHALLCRADGVRRWRYWSLEPGEPLNLADDDAYARAFLDRFTQAVETRLRSSGPVGCLLSGGMDSGSAAAVAARLLQRSGGAALRTFSVVNDDPDCIETRMIGLTTGLAHIEPTTIAPDELAAMWPDLDALTNAQANPFDGEMLVVRAAYAKAREAGVTVMLDGVAGDTTLSAADMVLWHMQRGHVRQAWREAKGAVDFWGAHEAIAARTAFFKAIRSALVPAPLRRMRQAQWRKAQSAREVETMVSPAFAERVTMAERRAANAAHVAGFGEASATNRAGAMLHPYAIVARERYDRIAAEFSIEPRDPFLDSRLLALCNRLPADQFQKDGWPKAILRRALDGICPSEVCWRVGKQDIGNTFIGPLLAERVQKLTLCDYSLMERYITEDTFNCSVLPQSTKCDLADALHLSYLARWLRLLDASKVTGDTK